MSPVNRLPVKIDEHSNVRCPGCKTYTYKSKPGDMDCFNCGQALEAEGPDPGEDEASKTS